MEETEEAKQGETRQGSSANLLLFFGPMVMLAGLSLVYLTRADITQGAAQSADYHRAPGCTPTGVASSGLPPCKFQTMTVTAKNQIDGDEGPDTYKLGLRPTGGAAQEVVLVGSEKANLFAQVAVGGTVQVKTWQGQILILTVPGWHCGTPDHPDAQLASAQKQAALGGFFALLGGVGTFYGWRIHKKKQASKV